MEINGNRKNAKDFYCEVCDFTCSKKSNYTKHINTQKHISTVNGNKKMPKNAASLFICEFCEKTYTTNSGLWKHNKKCNISIIKKKKITKKVKEDSLNYKEMFMDLINENKEIRKIMVNQQEQMKEQQEQIKDIIPKIGNTTIHNTNNKTNNFNMNIFLNEHCKDAINLVDFVNSLKIKLEDLENTAKSGYIDGISQVFINGLQDLDVTKRPIHCTDKMKEILYVRDKNNWEKDEDNIKIRRAISSVGKSNAMLVPEWVQNNPECVDDNKDLYWQIVDNTFVKDENKKIDQIVKNVAKEVVIVNNSEEDNEEEDDIDSSNNTI